jgi:hypothetical protein
MIGAVCSFRQVTFFAVIVALFLFPALGEARVVKIVSMSAPTVAFGGYSWPGVGQYEKITGVAYAEVDPSDRRNKDIVDITLAAPQAGSLLPGMTTSGKGGYLLNFYILKPKILWRSEPQPPARSCTSHPTAAARRGPPGRVRWRRERSRTITDATIPTNSFLMPPGYRWCGAAGNRWCPANLTPICWRQSQFRSPNRAARQRLQARL